MTVRKIAGVLAALLFTTLCSISSSASASPPETFFTTCTTHIYKFGEMEFEVEDGFTFLNRRCHGEADAPDVGLEWGLFPAWNYIEACAGFEYGGGENDPWIFDWKIGVPEENVLFCGSPAFTINFFEWGTKHRAYVSESGCEVERTDLNIVNFTLGKTIPWTPKGVQLRVFASYYHGSHVIGPVRNGVMGAFHLKFCPTVHCDGTEYYKYWIRGDYASGNNDIGGGGVCLSYYYKPGVHLSIGPAFFNSFEINGRWKILVHIEMVNKLFDTKKSEYGYGGNYGGGGYGYY